MYKKYRGDDDIEHINTKTIEFQGLTPENYERMAVDTEKRGKVETCLLKKLGWSFDHLSDPNKTQAKSDLKVVKEDKKEVIPPVEEGDTSKDQTVAPAVDPEPTPEPKKKAAKGGKKAKPEEVIEDEDDEEDDF